jgi:hypothetical protein
LLTADHLKDGDGGAYRPRAQRSSHRCPLCEARTWRIWVTAAMLPQAWFCLACRRVMSWQEVSGQGQPSAGRRSIEC